MVWPGVNATFFSGCVDEYKNWAISTISRLIFNLFARVCLDFVTDFIHKHLHLQMTTSAPLLGDACATKRRKEGLWYWPLDPHDSLNHHFVSLKSEEWPNFLRLVSSEIYFSRNCLNKYGFFYLPLICVIFIRDKSIIATAIRGLWWIKRPMVNWGLKYPLCTHSVPDLNPENIAQITDIYPSGWITCMWVVYALNIYCQSKQQLKKLIIFAMHELINLKWDIYNKMNPLVTLSDK